MTVSRTCLAFAPLLTAALWVSAAATPPASGLTRPATPPLQTPTVPPQHRYVGMVGCSAANCHGGNRAAGLATKGNGSYNSAQVWIQQDPHTQAYNVLGNKLSQQIAGLLHAADKQGADAKERTDCLTCHATTTSQEHAFDRARFSLSEGVGCEACHGPGEKWVEAHYTGGWSGKTGLEKASMGFRETKDLAARARICAECHVGSRDRDMHHDMIAAGHPRLVFEFSSYHEQLPKHWNEARDRSAHKTSDANPRPAFEAKAWLIGQLTAAEVGLQLLEFRATEQNTRWPELAEYNCSSCHHQLTPGEGAWNHRASGGALGRMQWGTWLTSTVDSKLLSPLKLNVGLQPVREVMTARSRDIAAVRKATEVRSEFRAAADAVSEMSLTEAQIRAVHAAALAAGQQPPADWESASQNYLAVVALQIALRELSGESPAATDDALKKIRDRLYSDSGGPGKVLDDIMKDYKDLASRGTR